MKRYFVENLTDKIQQNEFILDGEVFRYLTGVMRSKFGDEAIFFDETSKIQASLIGIDKRQCLLQKNADLARLPPSECKIHLGQVILTGDKMDFCLQKATELGVAKITPLYAQNFTQKLDAKRTKKKQEHWRKVIVSACEQSGNDAIPVLNDAENLTDWVLAREQQTKIFLDFAGENWQNFSTKTQDTFTVNKQIEICVLIGAAGGLSASEVAYLQAQNWQSINLGKRILRGETASLAILTLLQSQWGDLKL